MEGQKSTRRTKRDPQSRDFSCRCGKNYLSYAAAYTHVKQKHNSEKIYLDNIGKPPREKLPRGRPKEQKTNPKESDIEELELLEDSILAIHSLLKDVFPKMIVEGNEIVSPPHLTQHYNQITPLLNSTFLQLPERLTQFQTCFTHQLCKHFTAPIAARVQLVVNVLGQTSNEKDGITGQDEATKSMAELSRLDLWEGNNQVNTIIYETYLKWKGLQDH